MFAPKYKPFVSSVHFVNIYLGKEGESEEFGHKGVGSSNDFFRWKEVQAKEKVNIKLKQQLSWLHGSWFLQRVLYRFTTIFT